MGLFKIAGSRGVEARDPAGGRRQASRAQARARKDLFLDEEGPPPQEVHSDETLDGPEEQYRIETDVSRGLPVKRQ